MSSKVIFNNVKDFDLKQIFDCGQCFRWHPDGEGWSGIAGEHVAQVTYDSESLCLEIISSYGKADYWYDYFDLGRDYGAIKNHLSQNDEVMAKASALGSGIRILNQDKWETLVSFIISQNNNIPRIKKCIETLAQTLGQEVAKGFYALPNPEVLAKATEADLADCRLGYRAAYLIEAGKFISSEEGKKFMENLSDPSISGEEAVSALQAIHGVGPKVANCVALFCLGKVDCFPLDVWMKRVMNQLYDIPEKNTKEMKEYAREHFGKYGGIAQQYLFHYITHY